jgi:hypothetical protein
MRQSKDAKSQTGPPTGYFPCRCGASHAADSRCFFTGASAPSKAHEVLPHDGRKPKREQRRE